MPVDRPLVSFVVPCYNYARFLGDCLDSIFAQRGGYDFEIVAVDDCSTDHTLEVLASYTDPRLIVRRHERNQGHVVTINEGLQAARGELVARIDPDDRYRPGFLEAVVPRFAEYPDVALVYGDAAMIDAQGNITAERCDAHHGGRDFKGNELVSLMETNYVCAPTVMARREAWQACLPIPAGLSFSDWYFSLMIARLHDFYYVNEVVAEYRVHATNHHSTIAANKTEEPSLFWILDHVDSLPDRDAELTRLKRAAKERAHGAQYLTLAEKYFGFGLNGDARRCYWEAIRRRPEYLARPYVLRHLAGATMGRRLYEALKPARR